ncbi:hypothetical protein DINM_022156 [Dirofilaria immitis]|nr:hypothetical protein [Dirofilaria immitis]
MIQDADLVQLLPAGHSVGSIRTRRPLMYIFSGGNEDAAFFSVNGFSILFDGGDEKVVPYWNLIRNYDKISAAVITRISPKCLQGISAILTRKCLQECHPNFGSLIGNLPPSSAVNGDSLRAEGLKPIEALASTKLEAVTLYEVSDREGALRMIVLNPERNSKDLTSLLNALKNDENIEKFAALTSLALLWFGACSLEKLYASLEKLKNEEYLRYPKFTQAMKEKSSTIRPGKIMRKPTPTKTLPNLPLPRPASLQTTTLPAPGGLLKKVVRQSLTGAAPSRIAANARKPVTESTKALHDAKKNTTLEVKPKESEMGKMKPADKTGIKTAVAKEKVQSSDQVSIDVQPAKLLQSPAASTDLSSLSNTQNAVNPSQPEHSFDMEDKTSLSPKSPQIPESSFDPQIPADNGLLDGIEEPMKVRKISMDFSNEDKNFVENFMEEETGISEKGFDLLNSAVPSQDTPLLDSTPMTPSAPSIAAADVIHISSDSSAYHDNESDNEVTTHNRKVMHRENLQDLFGADISPFMAGLVTGIVDDSSTTLQELPPMNNDELEIPKSSEMLLSLNKVNNETLQHIQTSGIKREEFSIRSSVSSDSVTAQPDPALDEVIDSLFEASEMVDNARKTADELYHIQGLTTEINNANSAKAAALIDCVEHLTVKDVFDEGVTSVAHDINDNADALANQNAYEEKRAEEMYLPPMTSAARTHAKPVVNGVKTKPKLSQPLYFDIVFVPHHSAHPALKDMEAAKAFVTSIRSRRLCSIHVFRRYVLSGRDSIRTYFIDGLIAGKAAWNKPELEVDVLPTHDSDELTLYSHEKADEIAEAGISLRCSVERCTLRLSSGGSDDICAAFKFEI